MYQVTNEIVRSICKIAMYNKKCIGYNILISRNLLYPVTLRSRDAKHWNFYSNRVCDLPRPPPPQLLWLTTASPVWTRSSMEPSSTLNYGMEGDPNCIFSFNMVMKLSPWQEDSLISSWSLSWTRQGPEDWLLCLKEPGTCPFNQPHQSFPPCNIHGRRVLFMFWFQLVCILMVCISVSHVCLFVGFQWVKLVLFQLTLSLLMSYIYGAPSKSRNLTSYIYIYTYMNEIFYWGFCFLNHVFR
jgi:hypothetical protein